MYFLKIYLQALPLNKHLLDRANSKHITDFIGEARFYNILVSAILIFLVSSTLMMLWVLTRRLVAKFSKLRKARISQLLEEYLVAFIVADEEANDSLGYAKANKQLLNLLSKKKFSYTNNLNRQLFLPILLDTLQSLKGHDAVKIRTLYFRLHYQRDALHVLRTKSAWYKKGEAIKQLRAMDVKTAIQDILLHTNHESIAIQTAAMQAHISMVPKNPLNFLATYKGNLTHWQHAALYETLRRYHGQHLPDFQPWLLHCNPSVVTFAVRMIHAFRQVNAIPNLSIAIQHDNETAKKAAINAVVELGDRAALQSLLSGNHEQAYPIQLFLKNALQQIPNRTPIYSEV
jgi:hypothetical protein